jgi:hypothetical protein
MISQVPDEGTAERWWYPTLAVARNGPGRPGDIGGGPIAVTWWDVPSGHVSALPGVRNL